MKHYALSPRGLLFLRDARPMSASDVGLGANWPRPDQLWSALIHAFHRAWPQRQDWEGDAHAKREGKRPDGKTDNPNSSDRFGALKTFGPFPFKDGGFYFPVPLDLDMELVPCEGTDLPAPLKYAFRAKTIGKTKSGRWLSSTDYRKYLSADRVSSSDPELYDVERNIGIAIDRETLSTVQGQFYQAEYLRLRKDVSLAFLASCDIKPKGGNGTVDVFEKLGLPTELIIGGQQGVSTLCENRETDLLPVVPVTTRYVRWTLLTPAVFRAGWLPGWCADSGRDVAARKPLGTVMFKDCNFAKLVAARIGNPSAFSGWDLQTGPKPTQLAVPAGSCYVFDCETVENARKLAGFLNFKPCSDTLGEKGYGIGICSSLELK